MELVVTFMFRPQYLRYPVDPEPARSLEEEANLLLLPAIKPRFLGRPTHSLITVPSTLHHDVTSVCVRDYVTYKLSSLLSVLSHMNSLHTIVSCFWLISLSTDQRLRLKGGKPHSDKELR
jgi:hypothetical protein